MKRGGAACARALALLAPAVLALAAFTPAPDARAAAFEPREFSSPAVENRYRALIQVLRCLVCQNQNLADSDADLAGDLRREVYQMLEGGADEGQVVDFMVERYGDFVLYRPPLRPTTALLWAGPFVLAVVGLAVLARRIASRARPAPTELDEEERSRLDALTRDG